MHNGWIKLHRKILDNPFFADSKKLKLWVLCLLKASHTERKQVVGNQVIFLEKGQFVTGRVSLAVEYNKDVIGIERVSEQTLWRWMKILEKEQMLNINSTTKYSVITIANWNYHQQGEQQVFNNQTAHDQQSNTNKNVENVENLKNEKKEKGKGQKSSTSDVDFENAYLLYELMLENAYSPKPNFERWADHFRILRNNGNDDETIKYLLEWSQQDSYWLDIIRSAESFKVHFETLYLQSRE